MKNIAIDNKLFLVLEDEGFLMFGEEIKSFYKMLLKYFLELKSVVCKNVNDIIQCATCVSCTSWKCRNN